MIATSLALAAQEYTSNCAYIDLDVEEPNGGIFLEPKIETIIPCCVPVPQIDEALCTYCEKCANACVFNAIAIMPQLSTSRKALFFPELCHSCGACAYVCPIEGAIREKDKDIGQISIGRAGNIRFIEGRLNVGQPSGVPLIARIIRRHITQNQLTIIDSAPGTSCPVVESLASSHFIVLVTEPTPFGLNDLALTVEIVQAMKKPAAIIVNKDSDNNSSALIDNFSRKHNIPIILRVPYSLEIQQSYSRGVPLLQIMPQLAPRFKTIIKYIDTQLNQLSQTNQENQENQENQG